MSQGFIQIAEAALWTHATNSELPPGVVYDDIGNQYWIQDLSMFNSQNYDSQMSNISALNAHDSQWTNSLWSEWRMATLEDSLPWQLMESAGTADNFANAFQPTYSYWNSANGGFQVDGYVGRLNYSLATDSDYTHRYSGYYLKLNPDGTHSPYYMVSGAWADSANTIEQGAWVVADATVPPPIPVKIFLLLDLL